MSGTKNLLVMGAAMVALKRIDQEDPEVIMYARIFFACYVLVSLIINVALHFRVAAARDLTIMSVPPPPKGPFASPTPSPAPGIESTGTRSEADSSRERTTVLAYDMGLLQTARKSWLMNVVILTLVHMKMASVSPLIMSSVMGLVRYIDDPLFKVHILGYESVGALKRPFAEEVNPMAGLLKGMLPQLPALEPEESGTGSGTDSVRRSQRFAPAHVEELHEDEDDEDNEDDGDHEPAAMAEQDDPNDNDFETDGPDHEPKKSK